MTDKEKLADAELLARMGVDAVKWAQEFINVAYTHTWTIEDLNETFLITWFANAIEAGKNSVLSDLAGGAAIPRNEDDFLNWLGARD